MATVITVTNQKGGVGKTIIAYQLARALAATGKRVLAVDNDPQGNFSENCLPGGEEVTAHVMGLYQGQTPSPQPVASGLDLIGSDIQLAPVADQNFEVIFKLREGLESYRESYDYIIVDSVPSFGQLHIAALACPNFCLIPAKPSRHAFSGLSDQFGSIEKAKKRLNHELKILGIILNLIDTKNVIIERNFEERLRQEYGDIVFKAMLYKRVAYEEATTLGEFIEDYDKKTAKNEFDVFFQEFQNRIKEA